MAKQLISNKKLMEAGVYFGHKSSQWNPKMSSYISQKRKGTHIIDLSKTQKTLEFTYDLIKRYAEREAKFMFVGTKKQAKKTVKENAQRTNSYFMTERWLGGTLTNSRTIQQRVKRMFELEKLKNNDYQGYTKKEGVMFDKEYNKLHKNLEGISNMRQRPSVMIVADPSVDAIAVKEAKKLGIKVIAICDTNADPDNIDIVIPGNDDSVKSISLIITLLADAIAAANKGTELYAFKSDDEIILPEELPKPKRNNRRFGNRNFNAPRIFNNNSAPTTAPKKVISKMNYNTMTVVQLKEEANKKELKGYSLMKKSELVSLLEGTK
ncbi:MAG: 30S ribosomal protein S2 [Mollicutes bacterium PWAP]|nr:30S ribosomal protein S2 [Mollicutes bacterium PWAP]